VRGGVIEFGAVSVGTVAESPDGATAAALLALAEPGRLVLTDGASSQVIAELTDVFGAIVVALDTPVGTRASAQLNGAETVPLAAGAARGALLLRPSRSTAFIESVVRALAGGGRMVGAPAIATPH